MMPLGQAAFRSIIREGTMPVPGFACLMWIRGYGTHGYGVVRLGSITTTAPRLAFNAWNEIPLQPGEEVRHTCDWKPCAYYGHLLRGTKLDNMMDMKLRNRQQRKFHPMEIVDIRARAQRGETQKSIADRYRVSKQAISQIVMRASWSHIE